MDLHRTLRLEGTLFLMALGYLTRLPVPADLPESDDLKVRAVKYQPAVGALVGGIAATVLWLASTVLPGIVAVLLGVAAAIVVTGAFHEDGLADAADGLGAGRDRNQTLRIMNDARLGTYGGLALGLVLALRVALLAAMPPLEAGLALIAAHGVARMGVVHVMARNTSAHLVGLRALMPNVTPDGYRIALASTLVLMVPLVLAVGPLTTSFGFVAAVLCAQVVRVLFIRRIGGWTGDCLGAAQQLGEVGFYLGLALWL
ncbi:adenosylcobinamide-GDP ribazoletransferase [Ponticoccus alexandrii]|uniref:Adenosylcobinamide-GDP ribazoletransferase n=1 Tax=Ponticoccus alexandrii TaxID=1943633 RepID=A0ABX7FA89_9RHOB|nr:adenosylcobinamide-GDP ribazoletransferase [Ponticoccus alexandrii]QRF66712.1 adenosylcobinamide-GDP ribazoletransferase [Ponticoccus alexandrii]